MAEEGLHPQDSVLHVPVTVSVGIVVAVTGLVRLILADAQSYWLDELFSVQQYVLSASSLSDALSDLALTSIHPPLYQTMLYAWIQTFGPSEVATRTLSNLAVMATTWFVFVHGRHLADLRVGAVAATIFSLSYGAMAFGLETRSYALTLLLATLSTHLAVQLPGRLATSTGLRRFVPGWFGIGFLAVNSALLLTHYYNLFYWCAQFVVLLWLATRQSDIPFREIAPRITNLFLMQFTLFLVVWGRIAVAQFGGYRPVYEVEAVSASVPMMLASLAKQAFRVPGVSHAWLAILVGAMSMFILWPQTRGRNSEDPRVDTAAIVTTAMIAGPIVLAWLTFSVIGAERYSPRYLIYVLPHLALLGALAVVRTSDSLRSGGVRASPWTSGRRVSLFIGSLLACVVLPGTYLAATEEKADWRGISEQAVNLQRGDPGRSLAIYQTSFRPDAMSDFYLRRFSAGQIEATGVVRRLDESAGDFEFDIHLESDDTADGLMLLFLHHTVDQFPSTTRTLDERYEREVTLLDQDGRGIILFDLRGTRRE